MVTAPHAIARPETPAAPYQWPTLSLAVLGLSVHAVALGCALAGTLSVLLALPLCVFGTYVAFTPLHEAAHGNIAAKQPRLGALQLLIGWSCAALLYAPFPSFRSLHRQHHAHTNDPQLDPDAWVAGRSLPVVVLRCLLILPRYYAFFVAGPREQRNPLWQTGGFHIFALFAFIVAFRSGAGWTLLLLWPGAAVLASGLLAFAFDWLPHHPHRLGPAVRRTRVVLAPGIQWLTLGHHLHLVHHLWPDVPFWAYGRVFDSARADLVSAGAVVGGFPELGETDPDGAPKPPDSLRVAAGLSAHPSGKSARPKR